MEAANPDFSDSDSILDSLLEKADLQGHLTMDDLEEIDIGDENSDDETSSSDIDDEEEMED